jgi:hypothetical protein
MKLPFKRQRPLPVRILNAAAAMAGTARMALRRRV